MACVFTIVDTGQVHLSVYVKVCAKYTDTSALLFVHLRSAVCMPQSQLLSVA